MPRHDRDERTGGPELRATEARQGERGRPMLYVLIVGLVLAGAYIIGLMLYGQTDPGVPGTQQTETRQPGETASGGQDGTPGSAIGAGGDSGIPRPPPTEGVPARPAPVEPVRPSPIDPTIRQFPTQ